MEGVLYQTKKNDGHWGTRTRDRSVMSRMLWPTELSVREVIQRYCPGITWLLNAAAFDGERGNAATSKLGISDSNRWMLKSKSNALAASPIPIRGCFQPYQLFRYLYSFLYISPLTLDAPTVPRRNEYRKWATVEQQLFLLRILPIQSVPRLVANTDWIVKFQRQIST